MYQPLKLVGHENVPLFRIEPIDVMNLHYRCCRILSRIPSVNFAVLLIILFLFIDRDRQTDIQTN